MFSRLARDTSGAAAAEMILVAPLLIILMFGVMELGYFFYSEHVVVKAVRDGARFASREGFENFTCPGTVDSGVEGDIQRVTRTNQVASGGSARLPGWTNDNSVSVTVSCADNSSGTYSSIYEGLAGVPIVTVSATVAYSSLFSAIGFNTTSLTLSAASSAAVMGS